MYFFYKFICKEQQIFFLSVLLNNNCFPLKIQFVYNILRDKFLISLDVIFFIALAIFRVHIIIFRKTQKLKKKYLIEMKNSMKNGGDK